MKMKGWYMRFEFRVLVGLYLGLETKDLLKRDRDRDFHKISLGM